jgi:hypothetical protein
MNLTFFDQARHALAKSTDLDELKAIRGKAAALRSYAGQASEMGRQCAVIRLRAERRLGELLAKSIRAGNPQLSRTATIGLGRLGITRNQSSRWQTTATLPAEDFERYLTTREPTTAGLLKLARERRRQTGGPARGGHILTGPASQLWQRLADSSVDLILTDPPYSEIERYSELAKLAASKLRPGALCLAYCGQHHLPAVLEAMGQHLSYHWIFAIKFAGPHHAMYAAKIQNSWQPVVAFSKGKAVAAEWITDHLQSGGREKSLHPWQHNQGDAEYLIEKLTLPGALVVDPYCGSGTIPAACQRLKRRWLACEIDSMTARTARRRLAA